jgi:hypothetical protein
VRCEQRTFFGPRELLLVEVAAATPASTAPSPRRSIIAFTWFFLVSQLPPARRRGRRDFGRARARRAQRINII